MEKPAAVRAYYLTYNFSFSLEKKLDQMVMSKCVRDSIIAPFLFVFCVCFNCLLARCVFGLSVLVIAHMECSVCVCLCVYICFCMLIDREADNSKANPQRS